MRCLSLVFLLAGCAKTVTPSCDVGVEAGSTVEVGRIRDLDLLFVIDDSASMAEEQASVAAEIPRLVTVLTSGDLDGDGAQDFEPVRSIHVGVVTTDLGSGEVPVPTCDRPAFGDDARLVESCGAGPGFLSFDPGGDPDAFAETLGCQVEVGTSGCAFEQPLEAALKALSPSAPTDWTAEAYLPPTFYRGTLGHGDDAGFLRAGAFLVVVPVTDEDDCSVADPALFDPDGAYAGTDLNLRCSQHPEALHPIERFVDGLLGLRWRPGFLLFVPIVGIPPDLAPSPGESPSYDVLVGPEETRDPRMLVRADPERSDRLLPSCDVPGRGQAFPPVRLVRTARELEARGAAASLVSICADGLDNLIGEIVRQFRGTIAVDCISRAYRREPDRSLACTVELEPLLASCDAIPGATPILDAAGAPRVHDGRPVCALPQLVATEADVAAGVAPAGEGWWYDEHLGPFVCGGPPSRIALPELPFSTRVTLRCAPETLGVEHLDDACAVDADCGPRPTGPLFDPVAECIRGACRMPCEDDYDCRRADLVDAICVEGACAPAACPP